MIRTGPCSWAASPAPITTALLVMFFVLFSNTFEGAHSVDRDHDADRMLAMLVLMVVGIVLAAGVKRVQNDQLRWQAHRS